MLLIQENENIGKKSWAPCLPGRNPGKILEKSRFSCIVMVRKFFEKRTQDGQTEI